jgi:AAA domain
LVLNFNNGKNIMAIDFKSLKKKTVNDPHWILLYSEPGRGKTTTALGCLHSLYLQIGREAPPRGVEYVPVQEGAITDYSVIKNVLRDLLTQEHSFTNIIIDSLDELELLIWQETCKRGGFSKITDPNYSAGFKQAIYVWNEFIDDCKKLIMARKASITWLARCVTEKHEEPGMQSYNKYKLNLHKDVQPYILGSVEGVLFMNNPITLTEEKLAFGTKEKFAASASGGARWIYADARATFYAKKRFPAMPDKFQIPEVGAWDVIQYYLYSVPQVEPVQEFLPGQGLPVVVAPVDTAVAAVPAESQVAADIAA